VAAVAASDAAASPAVATGTRPVVAVPIKEIGTPHRQLLEELSGQISNRLEAGFTELPGADGASVGVELRERGRAVVMELPMALLASAVSDAIARETVRVRIKARRDRMLFRPPPVPLPKHITSVADPAGSRFGYGRGPGGRGRR
jgi:hypothetical protein